MPWYRIFANHGPGHQSSDEKFRYFDHVLTAKQRKEEWEEIFAYNYNYPIGDVELLKGLPEHILTNKIQASKDGIDANKRMLLILAETQSIPVIAYKLDFDAMRVQGMNPTIYTARRLSDPSVTARGATKDKAVASLLRALRKSGKKVSKRDFAIINR